MSKDIIINGALEEPKSNASGSNITINIVPSDGSYGGNTSRQGNSGPKTHRSAQYVSAMAVREKSLLLKNQIKCLLYERESLLDDLKGYKTNHARIKKENTYLADRLLRYDALGRDGKSSSGKSVYFDSYDIERKKELQKNLKLQQEKNRQLKLQQEKEEKRERQISLQEQEEQEKHARLEQQRNALEKEIKRQEALLQKQEAEKAKEMKRRESIEIAKLTRQQEEEEMSYLEEQSKLSRSARRAKRAASFSDGTFSAKKYKEQIMCDYAECEMKSLLTSNYCKNHAYYDPNSGYGRCAHVNEENERCRNPISFKNRAGVCRQHRKEIAEKPQANESNQSYNSESIEIVNHETINETKTNQELDPQKMMGMDYKQKENASVEYKESSNSNIYNNGNDNSNGKNGNDNYDSGSGSGSGSDSNDDDDDGEEEEGDGNACNDGDGNDDDDDDEDNNDDGNGNGDGQSDSDGDVHREFKDAFELSEHSSSSE